MKSWTIAAVLLGSAVGQSQEPAEPRMEAAVAMDAGAMRARSAPTDGGLKVLPVSRGDGGVAVTPRKLPDGGVAPAIPAGKVVEAPPAKVLSRETIREVMTSHLKEVQTCYEDSLSSKYGQDAKGMAGQIVTSFVITKKGKVKNAEISKAGTTVKDKKFWHCVTELLKTMEFPAPKNGKDQPVQFPYKLTVKS